MKELSEIKKLIPYYRQIFTNTYRTELTLAGMKGSVIWGEEMGWDHVSFAPYNGKTPTWNAMCELKDIFFNPEEVAIQIHPKKSEYVNIKDNCLHLWWKDGIELPM